LGGRYYEIVTDFNVTRQDAQNSAEQSSFVLNGVTYNGHLATITSAEEEALIEGVIFEGNGDSYFSSEPASFWLGGEYVAGEWTWTSGPEDGDAFSFTDWDTDNGGQEEGQGATEPYLVLNMFSRSDIDGVWYSYDAGDTPHIRGYVIEYEPSGVLDVIV
jgi:hypothetical protein